MSPVAAQWVPSWNNTLSASVVDINNLIGGGFFSLWESHTPGDTRFPLRVHKAFFRGLKKNYNAIYTYTTLYIWHILNYVVLQYRNVYSNYAQLCNIKPHIWIFGTETGDYKKITFHFEQQPFKTVSYTHLILIYYVLILH